MLNRLVIGIALLVTLFILAGCATYSMSLSERAEAYDEYIVTNKLEKLDRITTFRFDGWADLSNRHLIISTSFNRDYLLTLQRDCFDLYASSGIVINNNGSLLQSKFDSISIPSNIPIRCFIDGIYEVSRDQKRELFAIGKNKEGQMKEVSEQNEEAASD